MRRSFAAAALACLPLVHSAPVPLQKYVVVQGMGEDVAVQMALKDLEKDLFSTTGIAPIYMSSPPAPNTLPPDTVVVYFGSTAAAPWLSTLAPASCFSGYESHCVVALSAAAAGNGYTSILATGTGTRGAIYGAYSFSDAVLGFKPLFLFTDTPAAYGPVSFDANLTLTYSPPTYRHRAVFVNDEDLSAVHRADPYGRNVMDLSAWDVFFQTALRSKANAFLVGTNPFPDNAAIGLAARRGLIVAHHHYNLLGSNVFSWPLGGSEWDWSTNAGTMSYLWRASIDAQAGYPEVQWSVGLRGLNDESYAACTPGNDEACGRTISEVMANQTAWVRSYPNQANATIVLYLWQELLGLLSAGYLVIPDGVHIIFTDAGQGYVRTDANWTQYAAGCYYHTAVYGGGQGGDTNQVSEMIPVSRIAQQLTNVVTQSNSTTTFIINLSDLKPNPMTSAAVLDLVWNVQPWNVSTDWNATARAWYARWAADYNGLTSAADQQTYALIWEAFFNVPYIFEGNADVLANAISAGAGAIAKDWQGGQGVSARTVQSIQQSVWNIGADSAVVALASVNSTAWSLFPSVPVRYRGFYTSHSLLQFTTELALVQALLDLLHAAQALQPQTPGGPVPNPSAGLSLVTSALSSLDAMLTLRRASEGDPSAWSDSRVSGGLGPIVNIPAAYPLRAYWLADSLTDMNWPRGAVYSAQQALLSPTGTPILPVRAQVWYQFEAYQQALAPFYPYANYDATWNLPTYVRANCDGPSVQSGACANGPDGGWFGLTSTARLTLQVMTSSTGDVPHNASIAAMREISRQRRSEGRRQGLLLPQSAPLLTSSAPPTLAIHYTTDGTVPTATSPLYTPGQAPTLASLLTAGQSSVSVRAMAWINGEATGQVTSTVWQGR